MDNTFLDHGTPQRSEGISPLAFRIRPRSIDEFVGQRHIVGKGKFLRRAIDADHVPSLILWGPPGTGKTTLAHIVANHTKARFSKLSAVNAGVQEVRKVVSAAGEHLNATGLRTILFLDEIHRFSKSQQDSLLPSVEDGTITLIGATTENPSFEVISALLSRAMVLVLKPLSKEDIQAILSRAGKVLYGDDKPFLTREAMEWLLSFCNGDARVAVNALETARTNSEQRPLSLELLTQLVSSQSTHYKGGENHYDVISAFIKSVRASSPDAALYYLARMLHGGEDPLFIARRIVILAAEDIGLADPSALPIAVAAQQAVSFIGMPEAQIPLAEATIYLATAPKSNSVVASINSAMQSASDTPTIAIPMHLRNAPTAMMKNLGYGKGYDYPHDHPGNYVSDRSHLPEKLTDQRFYTPGKNPNERAIAARLNFWRKARQGGT